MTSVVVVDYGAGNLLSVCRAFRHVGAEVVLASTAEQVAAAERLVLPGVGAFGAGMDALRARGLVEQLKAFAATGRPLLGICVGMQMLFEESEEFGRHEGLGLIPGRVSAIPPFRADGSRRRIPHIGWGSLMPVGAAGWEGSVLAGSKPSTAVYFVHSFMGVPKDPAHALAMCDHDGELVLAAVRHDNLTGCQFHPEKSGPAGLAMLENFLRA